MELSEETKKAFMLQLLGMANEKTSISEDNGGWKIVILQRGWVVVGKYYREGNDCRLEDALVIRRWGTTKGLGELALNGPLTDTKLEKSGTIRFNVGAEVCRMDCKTTNW